MTMLLKEGWHAPGKSNLISRSTYSDFNETCMDYRDTVCVEVRTVLLKGGLHTP